MAFQRKQRRPRPVSTRKKLPLSPPPPNSCRTPNLLRISTQSKQNSRPQFYSQLTLLKQDYKLQKGWAFFVFHCYICQLIAFAIKLKKKKKSEGKWDFSEGKRAIWMDFKALFSHSSTRGWRIPQTEEPGGLQSTGVVKSPIGLSDTDPFLAVDTRIL